MSVLKRANPDSRQLVPVSGQLEETGETEKKGREASNTEPSGWEGTFLTTAPL